MTVLKLLPKELERKQMKVLTMGKDKIEMPIYSVI